MASGNRFMAGALVTAFVCTSASGDLLNGDPAATISGSVSYSVASEWAAIVHYAVYLPAAYPGSHLDRDSNYIYAYQVFNDAPSTVTLASFSVGLGDASGAASPDDDSTYGAPSGVPPLLSRLVGLPPTSAQWTIDIDPAEHTTVLLFSSPNSYTWESATLANGGEGDTHALPSPIHEPAAASVLLLSAVALLRRRKTRASTDRYTGRYGKAGPRRWAREAEIKARRLAQGTEHVSCTCTESVACRNRPDVEARGLRPSATHKGRKTQRSLRMKKLTIITAIACLTLSMSITAQESSADLILVDSANDVYKTTTGGQTLFWYLKLSNTFNKTYAQQVGVANNLTLNLAGVPDDWHLPTPSELAELLGQPMGNTQATLVANTLAGLGYSTGTSYTNKYTGRYESVGTGYYAGHHRIGQLSKVFNSTDFTPNYGFSYAQDTASQGDLAAWIVTVPEPATMSVLAAGALALLRRRRR